MDRPAADRAARPPTRALRILLLAPQPFFEVRGTPLAVLALARALGELGHSVDLLTYPSGEDVAIPGVRQRRSLRLPVGRVRPGFSWKKLALDVPFAVQAAWRIAIGRYDVVHAVEEAAHLIAPLAHLRGLAFVMDVDSSIPDQLRHAQLPLRAHVLRLVSALETNALRSATAVVTVCSALTDGVRQIVPQAAVFQIEDPPLVDVSLLPGDDVVRRLRAALGLGGGPVALYTGNFEPYQGVDLLVEAAALVPEVQFVLMGGEQHEIEALLMRAAQLGCRERCTFVGKRAPLDLPLYLALADVVVSPRCRGGNTPFKVYTYLAAERPLVATRIATHTQLLDDSLAMLTEPTPEGLARGIRAVVADPVAARERARLGRALIEREYGPVRYREKVATAYSHVAQAIALRRGTAP